MAINLSHFSKWVVRLLIQCTISDQINAKNAVHPNVLSFLVAPKQEIKVVKLGKVYRFNSFNFPRRMMRHRGFQMWLDESNINAKVYVKDSSFKLVRGLAGKGISFQSVNYPQRYLRHRGWLCYIEVNDGSQLFRKDASFIPRAGLAARKSLSFESVNYPGHFLRHSGFRLRVNKLDNSALFKKDATWLGQIGK